MPQCRMAQVGLQYDCPSTTTTRELRQQKAKLAMFHIKVHIKSETIITHDQEQYDDQRRRRTGYELRDREMRPGIQKT